MAGIGTLIDFDSPHAKINTSYTAKKPLIPSSEAINLSTEGNNPFDVACIKVEAKKPTEINNPFDLVSKVTTYFNKKQESEEDKLVNLSSTICESNATNVENPEYISDNSDSLCFDCDSNALSPIVCADFKFNYSKILSKKLQHSPINSPLSLSNRNDDDIKTLIAKRINNCIQKGLNISRRAGGNINSSAQILSTPRRSLSASNIANYENYNQKNCENQLDLLNRSLPNKSSENDVSKTNFNNSICSVKFSQNISSISPSINKCYNEEDYLPHISFNFDLPSEDDVDDHDLPALKIYRKPSNDDSVLTDVVEKYKRFRRSLSEPLLESKQINCIVKNDLDVSKQANDRIKKAPINFSKISKMPSNTQLDLNKLKEKKSNIEKTKAEPMKAVIPVQEMAKNVLNKFVSPMRKSYQISKKSDGKSKNIVNGGHYKPVASSTPQTNINTPQTNANSSFTTPKSRDNRREIQQSRISHKRSNSVGSSYRFSSNNSSIKTMGKKTNSEGELIINKRSSLDHSTPKPLSRRNSLNRKSLEPKLLSTKKKSVKNFEDKENIL